MQTVNDIIESPSLVLVLSSLISAINLLKLNTVDKYQILVIIAIIIVIISIIIAIIIAVIIAIIF